MNLKQFTGVPFVAQWLTNPTRNHDDVGSIPSLIQWVGDLAFPSAVVWVTDKARTPCGCGCGMDQQLAWACSDLTPSLGTSICSGCSLKKRKKEKKKKKKVYGETAGNSDIYGSLTTFRTTQMIGLKSYLGPYLLSELGQVLSLIFPNLKIRALSS